MTKEITETTQNLPATPDSFVGMALEDLRELDHTALPTVINDGEMFKVRGANWGLPAVKDFNAVILDCHKYEYHRCSNQDHAIPGFYTMDGETDSKGEPIEEIHNMWADDGCTYSVSHYVGAHVLMLTPEDAFNGLAIVTISPTSVKRFQAFLQLELGRQRKLQPFQAVTKFKLGNPVKGRGGKMFSPWEFEFVEPFDPSVIE